MIPLLYLFMHAGMSKYESYNLCSQILYVATPDRRRGAAWSRGSVSEAIAAASLV